MDLYSFQTAGSEQPESLIKKVLNIRFQRGYSETRFATGNKNEQHQVQIDRNTNDFHYCFNKRYKSQQQFFDKLVEAAFRKKKQVVQPQKKKTKTQTLHNTKHAQPCKNVFRSGCVMYNFCLYAKFPCKKNYTSR
jgi:hypothetical protein